MSGWFLSLLIFVLVAGFTPGPNNIIALSIGFNHGYKKVLPHIAGVTVGFPVMLILIGLVLMPIMDRFHTIFLILKYTSIAYIFYLSYKIATSSVNEEEIKTDKKPITFLQSVAFQWINPKAWAGALSTVSVYIPSGEDFTKGLLIAALTSAVTIVFAVSAWAITGKKIKTFLKNPKQIKTFNYTMATALVVSVLMMLS